MKWIAIHPENGARLCNDGKFRSFACFGTLPSCVKEYKSNGWALKAAQRLSANGEGYTVRLDEEWRMDASGRMTREVPVPGKPGFHEIEVKEFIDGRYRYTKEVIH